ncbi:YgiQ family radical SAM protein [Chromobacterium sinusclupearum]|uniref:YgiQ family radical SAM protein n=1 Tax=Chromobacterium sinusclupearum TaxID=2077146 RepID=A0A2K4MQB4_9NEIS|nr:YgiQ family radical SAM protein [Chromobacterium sinusclupearum]POA98975.1 YgiQ family radical SAM protein [Chromobacterium sinusclupearum]
MTTPQAAKPIDSYRKYWASRFGTAPFLPMTRAEMDQLGWDSCDIILVTGDCYIDHPSFGMALVGRLLEAQGFRVGIIAQPDWHSADAFRELGRPNLFFGVTAGNMDSMINRYTADRKPRSDDAYTPHAAPNKRPDRAVTVYAQRCREAYPGIGVMIGSIEASLRRIAHYDYWSDKVRQSVLITSKADILLFGNAERALVEIAHRAAKGEKLSEMRDIRGTAFIVPHGWKPDEEWQEMDSSVVDEPGRVDPHLNPYQEIPEQAAEATKDIDPSKPQVIRIESREERLAKRRAERAKTVLRIPAYEAVAHDPVLYAHASRTLHLESNPGNARALVQLHGERDVWLNPPPIPLSTEEMDFVYGLPYARNPHPSYGDAHIPAWEMIKYSVNIMRGCFGGCTFCSITEHEGRIIQSRSEESILREIEEIRDKTPGFKGHISDLGGPTANMYRLACKDPKIESSCRKLSCVFPDICENLNTDHSHLIQLYRKARALPGVKKINIQSGLRYDLAVRSPEYIKELVQHHVGGYLKIAPEHTEDGPLSKMMKPGMGAYDKFKELFERFSRQAGKEQYLIPYFIAAHPGTSDEDMMNLALWLKKNNFRLDQVQTFTPTPMALATTMWHTRRNPLKRLGRSSEKVDVVRDGYRRKLHKAFLRYHHPDNWQIIHDALINMGRSDLIGHSKHCLIPPTPPGDKAAAVRHKMGATMSRGKPNGARQAPQGQRGKPATVGARGTGGKPASGKPQAGRSPAKPGGKTGRNR